MDVIGSLFLEGGGLVLDEDFKFLGFRKGDEIAVDQELSAEIGCGVLDFGFGLSGLEEKVDGWIVLSYKNTVFQKVERKVHVAEITKFKPPSVSGRKKGAAGNAMIKGESE